MVFPLSNIPEKKELKRASSWKPFSSRKLILKRFLNNSQSPRNPVFNSVEKSLAYKSELMSYDKGSEERRSVYQ
jgi:hypothetical protein